MAARPITMGDGRGILDAAFETFLGVCEAVPMLGALGIKAAGSALNGIESATGALVQATDAPAQPSTEPASPTFANLIQNCGKLNLGLHNQALEVDRGETAQLSAAAFFCAAPRREEAAGLSA